MNEEIEQLANQHMVKKRWPSFVRKLEECQKEVPQGKVRDAMINLLGLRGVEGIDIDFIQLLKNCRPQSVQELREQHHPIFLDHLEKQIERGDTYLLDIDAISETTYAILVQDLINKRLEEMSGLEPLSSVEQILSTYYGFEILTLGRPPTDGPWTMPPEVAASVSEVSQSIGKKTEVVGGKPTIRPEIFKPCSDSKATLLATIARLTLHVSSSAQNKALQILSKSGDSRAIPYLKRIYNATPTNSTRVKVVNALCEIGHPDTLSFILDDNDQPISGVSLTLPKISKIRHPRTESILKNAIQSSGKTTSVAAAIKGLGRMYSLSALEMITSQLDSRKGTVRAAAVFALADLGHDGVKILKNNLKIVSRVVSTEHYPIRILESLCTIPGFSDTKEFVNLVVEALKPAFRRLRNRNKPLHWRQYDRRMSILKSRGSLPMDIFNAFPDNSLIFNDKRVLKEIGNEFTSFAFVLKFGPDIPEQLRIAIPKALRMSLETSDDPLQPLEFLLAEPFFLELPEISKTIEQYGDEFLVAILKTEKVQLWMSTLVDVIKFSDLDFNNLTKHFEKNRTHLPQAILNLGYRFPYINLHSELREVLISAILKMIDDPMVYEAVLTGHLQKNTEIQEALKSRIGTTFKVVLRQDFLEQDWTPERWLISAIDTYFQETDSPNEFARMLIDKDLTKHPSIRFIVNNYSGYSLKPDTIDLPSYRQFMRERVRRRKREPPPKDDDIPPYYM